MAAIVKNPTLTAATIRLYNRRNALGLYIEMIIDCMNIARSTLYRWIHMYNNNKLSFVDNPKASVDKKFIRGCPKKFSDVCINYIIAYVKDNPQFNFKVLRKRISDFFNVKISRGYLYFILKKNNVVN
jgi:hypothetical protein